MIDAAEVKGWTAEQPIESVKRVLRARARELGAWGTIRYVASKDPAFRIMQESSDLVGFYERPHLALAGCIKKTFYQAEILLLMLCQFMNDLIIFAIPGSLAGGRRRWTGFCGAAKASAQARQEQTDEDREKRSNRNWAEPVLHVKG
jgi:hypothetical protein